MIALEDHLRRRRDSGRKLLVPYVTGGLGPQWTEVVEAFASAGADAIEVGLPFSDPMIDGTTIQEASQRSLDAGATPSAVVAALSEVDVDVPLVAMTYYNLVHRAGHTRFAAELAANGVSGTIVPDLPLEESAGWEQDAAAAGVANVLLASPVTPDDRLAMICERSRGFVYGVGLMGVTGERARLSESAATVARRLKAATDKPVVIGIGVSTPAHARQLAHESDGVVVGSALMRRMLDGATPDELGSLVSEFRAALDAG